MQQASNAAANMLNSPAPDTYQPPSGTAAQVTIPSPIPPIMGGLVDGGGYLVAFTGGKPKPDWSGLETSSQVNTNPNQLRIVGSKGVLPYNNRRTGLATKYKHGGDLETLMTDMTKHLKNHGMDTIAYRKDPHDASKMVHCLKEHPRFNLTYVRSSSESLKEHWDAYDLANDECAIHFFLDSIDTSMRTKVEKRQKESDTFVDVVFIFLMLETPYTAKKFEAIKAQIRARKPQQYSGQNILAMCEDLRDDIKKLSVMYDPQLTLDMLTNFLMADGGLEFQKQLLDKKLELEEMLPSLFHLPVVEQEKKLVEKELGWEDILLLAEKRYQLQMQPNNITWPPAKSVTDSKAPPSNFSTTGVSANLLQAAVNLLIQQANNSGSSSQSKETRSCFNCNEPGHVAKDCPKPKKKKGPGNNSKQSGSTKKNKSKNPRFIPPDDDNLKPVSHKNGDPVYEKLIKGTKFYWCGKCKKWTTTHSTPEHTGKTTDVWFMLIVSFESSLAARLKREWDWVL
jgi:hypothetical protein